MIVLMLAGFISGLVLSGRMKRSQRRDVAVCLCVNWKNTRLTYAYIMRSLEFKGQGEE